MKHFTTEALMSDQTLSSPAFPALRVPAALFQWAFAVCATVTPVLLVIYAFMISPDSMERAHTIVQGAERIVFLLAASLILRAFYLVGVKDGSAYLETASGSMRASVPV